MTDALVGEIGQLTSAGSWMWTGSTGVLASDGLPAGIDDLATSGHPSPVPLVARLIYPADRDVVLATIHTGLRQSGGTT